MKQPKSIRSKTALASLVLALASTIPGSAMVINVPADYPTIQAAVNAAASGDEIQIGPGVYTNQVVIAYKNLTLSGSPGAILRATPNMESTLDPYTGAIQAVALLGIFKSTNVVSGLTFEGERLGYAQTTNTLNGIVFFVAGGRVENCRFMGFRRDTLGLNNSRRWSIGVHVLNPRSYGGGLVNVDVVRNTFADNTVSIELTGDAGPGFDPTLLRTTFAVEDNTIVGNGPDANGRQVGIQILAGARGEVKRNTISDHAYIGTNAPVPLSFGILASDDFDIPNNPLAALQPIRFEGNILRSNQVNMALVRAANSTNVNNSFEGAGPGYTGLSFSGDNVQVVSNRFSDMETGIRLSGNDPDFGTYLGIASNAVLIVNDFCNVSTNIDQEEPATYTEIGTLPPCTGPVLDTNRSVLLSWPYSYNGYSLETATNMNGPWTISDATVFQQDGQNSAAVPADKPEQIYRLVKP